MSKDLEQLRAENARLRRRLADCIVWMDTREEAQPGMPRLCDIARAALSADPAPAVDGPDWEGFGRALMENWPTGNVEGSELFDLSHKYRLIVEAPGGYDPEEGE